MATRTAGNECDTGTDFLDADCIPADRRAQSGDRTGHLYENRRRRQRRPSLAKAIGAAERGARILCDYMTIAGFLTKDSDKYALTHDVGDVS